MRINTGILGTGIDFTQFLITLVIIIFGSIAFKISFNFDLNKYLESRKNGYIAKAKNACLHFEFIKISDTQIEVSSFFVSPSGTQNWICQRCSLIRLHLDEELQQRTADHYLDNLKEYNKRNRKFNKMLKKAGYT